MGRHARTTLCSNLDKIDGAVDFACHRGDVAGAGLQSVNGGPVYNDIKLGTRGDKGSK